MSSNLVQATSDRQLISLWLHGKATLTQKAYASEVNGFLEFVNKPIAQIVLGDVQSYLSSRSHLAANTQARSTQIIKSLFSFAHKIGYIPWNLAAPIKAPRAKNTLAERILSEEQVRSILAAEPNERDRTMLRLLYAGALRVSELCDLKWRDLQQRGGTGQITVYGKGAKTGVVLLPESIWADLRALGAGEPDAYVFPAASGRRLHRTQVWRIVKRSAGRVGLKASPHWFRHAHASHSLERGASVALVQATLRHSNIATTSKYLHVRPNQSSSNFLDL